MNVRYLLSTPSNAACNLAFSAIFNCNSSPITEFRLSGADTRSVSRWKCPETTLLCVPPECAALLSEMLAFLRDPLEASDALSKIILIRDKKLKSLIIWGLF